MPHASEEQGKLAGRIGFGTCVAATLLALCLHAVHLTHAGALWRDEAAGVRLATSGNFTADLRVASEYFPQFYFGLLRRWSALGLGASDFALRVLGFLTGAALLGAVWLNARLMGIRWPYICLGLLAANLTVIRWGDSLRAYGCGALFILLTLGLIWRLVRTSGWRWFLAASLAAALSVQTLYSNAFLVLAACCAACLVCIRHGQWKTTALVLGVGLLAALSLLPYLPVLRLAQRDASLQRIGFEAGATWSALVAALGSGLRWPVVGWLGLFLFAAAAGAMVITARAKAVPVAAQDLILFGSAALAAGTAGALLFLGLSGFPPQPWYFLAPMVFAAAAADAALAHWCRRFWTWPLLFVVIMVALPFAALLRELHSRQTNVDLVARQLCEQASPGDLILVFPFFLGITFDRYFEGPIAWTTVPPVEDHRFHRGDLVRNALWSNALLQDVLSQATRTLQAGRTVWLVGYWSPPQPGEGSPPELPPPPQSDQPAGFADGSLCTYLWERHVVHLIVRHAVQGELVAVQPNRPVCDVENVRVIKATGWRDRSTAPSPPPP